MTSIRRAAAWLLMVAACTTTAETAFDTATPQAVAAGEEVFAASCAQCHGEAADGTDQGPPLVDNIYRSSHHADGAISLAVSRGVPQHHWNFGPMLAVDGLSETDVTNVIAYIRKLQADAGIE